MANRLQIIRLKMLELYEQEVGTAESKAAIRTKINAAKAAHAAKQREKANARNEN